MRLRISTTLLLLCSLLTTGRGYVYDTADGVIVVRDESLATAGNGNGEKAMFSYALDLASKGPAGAWLYVGSPKARDLSGREVRGAFSVCEVDLNGGGRGCLRRDPDLSAAPAGDEFGDQMLGVSVLANEDKVRCDIASLMCF